MGTYGSAGGSGGFRIWPGRRCLVERLAELPQKLVDLALGDDQRRAVGDRVLQVAPTADSRRHRVPRYTRENRAGRSRRRGRPAEVDDRGEVLLLARRGGDRRRHKAASAYRADSERHEESAPHEPNPYDRLRANQVPSPLSGLVLPPPPRSGFVQWGLCRDDRAHGRGERRRRVVMLAIPPSAERTKLGIVEKICEGSRPQKISPFGRP